MLRPRYFFETSRKYRSLFSSLTSTYRNNINMVQGVEIECDASGDRFILNKSPADGHLIGKVRCSTQTDISSSIETLKIKQKKWKATPLEKRIDIIRHALTSFEDHDTIEKLKDLISEEMGKTLSESRDEVQDILNMKGALLDLVYDANKPEELDNAIIVRDPLGLVAVISPWNFPSAELMLLSIPALAAGNGVIVKPSEMTPQTGQFTVKTLSADGTNDIPIVTCQGDGGVGEMLVKHPDVKMIAMTGSSATGKKIMTTCGENLKRVVLELGGKDPMIVFDDADLTLAAEEAVAYSTCNAGQVCCSVERIYVASSVKEEFERRCIEKARTVRSGPHFNPQSTMGPLVSQMQRDIVARQVDDALSKGAKALYVGDVIANDEERSEGNYYPATVLTNVTKDMIIGRKETFGPVVVISEFDGSEEKAVSLANDTEYGLSASVYTKNLEKGRRVAAGISAGQVAINSWALDVAPIQCPWIGHKESGMGYHSGKDGYRQFSLPKSIVFRKDEK